MDCNICGQKVPSHSRSCPSCGNDCGFPNVRLADAKDECLMLQRRVDDALASTVARGCSKNLNAFGDDVKTSKAVISRPLAKIHELLSNERVSYVSFQKEVASGARQPQDNEFDSVRTQYEEALFPHFSGNIIFALLSLTDAGMIGYGTHTMTLKDQMIGHRATVFEENPHNFVEKHGIVLNKPIPPGYRASWGKRHELSKAKLHSRIDSMTKKAQHAGILATDNGGSGNSDWIEVHIYGSINRNAIEGVSGPKPKLRADQAIWRSIQSTMKNL